MPPASPALAWNQVGPPRPYRTEGTTWVVTGYEASSPFNAALLRKATVLALTVPTKHASIVTATVDLIGDGKDAGTLQCELDDPSATLNSYQATLVPDSAGEEELPITLTGATGVGGKISPVCSVVSNPPGRPGKAQTGSEVAGRPPRARGPRLRRLDRRF